MHLTLYTPGGGTSRIATPLSLSLTQLFFSFCYRKQSYRKQNSFFVFFPFFFSGVYELRYGFLSLWETTSPYLGWSHIANFEDIAALSKMMLYKLVVLGDGGVGKAGCPGDTFLWKLGYWQISICTVTDCINDSGKKKKKRCRAAAVRGHDEFFY